MNRTVKPKPIDNNEGKKKRMDSFNKILAGVLTAAIVAGAAAILDARTRIAVIEGNRYTDEDARRDQTQLLTRVVERIQPMESRFSDFSPRTLEKKVDNIESLVREIRSWQIGHAESHVRTDK
jgi:hypothetical protein